MTRIINTIKEALSRTSSIEELPGQLQDSGFVFKEAYPIALLHSAARLKDAAEKNVLEAEGLLDADGYTPAEPSAKQLDFLAQHRPRYLKIVRMMCLAKQSEEPLHFRTKRPDDYWKKIEDAGHILAMIEISEFDDRTTLPQAEFELREIIRKRKEVPSLKETGFIWIAVSSLDLSGLLKHYFGDNVSQVGTGAFNYQFGWKETLSGINMRNFLFPPQ